MASDNEAHLGKGVIVSPTRQWRLIRGFFIGPEITNYERDPWGSQSYH